MKLFVRQVIKKYFLTDTVWFRLQSLEIMQRTFLQILRNGSGLDYSSLDASRSCRVLRHVLRPPWLLFGEDAAPSGFLFGVDSPVDVRRCPFLGDDAGSRCFTHRAVISSEFTPRGDDAVVVNHAASSARCALDASMWAVLLPPGLLLEDSSNFLSDARNDENYFRDKNIYNIHELCMCVSACISSRELDSINHKCINQ